MPIMGVSTCIKRPITMSKNNTAMIAVAAMVSGMITVGTAGMTIVETTGMIIAVGTTDMTGVEDPECIVVVIFESHSADESHLVVERGGTGGSAAYHSTEKWKE